MNEDKIDKEIDKMERQMPDDLEFPYRRRQKDERDQKH